MSQLIKREILITGINVRYSFDMDRLTGEVPIEVSFTQSDNDMVLNIMMPLEIVKNMNLDDKYELIINKVE